MYLLWSIQKRREEQEWDKSSLHILTCDHNTREDTKKEVEYVKWMSGKNNFYSTTYLWNDFREAILRKRRHEVFVKYCEETGSNILLLWHHLDDRIETSFLNLKRWCGVRWLQWLEMEVSHFLNPTITIIRPLLSLTKKEILIECKNLDIIYHIDPSNKNDAISKRNKMRKVLSTYFNTAGFYKSMNQVYKAIDMPHTERTWSTNILYDEKGDIYYIHTDKDRNHTITTKSGEWDSNLLYQLYTYLHIAINPRSTTLINLSQALNKRSGNKVSYNGFTIQGFRYGSIVSRN